MIFVVNHQCLLHHQDDLGLYKLVLTEIERSGVGNMQIQWDNATLYSETEHRINNQLIRHPRTLDC